MRMSDWSSDLCSADLIWPTASMIIVCVCSFPWVLRFEYAIALAQAVAGVGGACAGVAGGGDQRLSDLDRALRAGHALGRADGGPPIGRAGRGRKGDRPE